MKLLKVNLVELFDAGELINFKQLKRCIYLVD